MAEPLRGLAAMLADFDCGNLAQRGAESCGLVRRGNRLDEHRLFAQRAVPGDEGRNVEHTVSSCAKRRGVRRIA